MCTHTFICMLTCFDKHHVHVYTQYTLIHRSASNRPCSLTRRAVFKLPPFQTQPFNSTSITQNYSKSYTKGFLSILIKRSGQTKLHQETKAYLGLTYHPLQKQTKKQKSILRYYANLTYIFYFLRKGRESAFLEN